MKPVVHLERNVTQTKNEFFVIKDIEKVTSITINKMINLKQGEGPQIEICVGDTITPEQSKLIKKKSKVKITDYVSPTFEKWLNKNEQ
jgi:hypothetical protein